VDLTELEGKPPPSDSFCGNSACHANEWSYTGFASPELEPFLARQVYILQNTSPYLLEGVPRNFDETFSAMFDGRCVACHGGSNAEAGLDLSTFELLMAGGESGSAVVPGDPEASPLVQRQSGPGEHFGQLLEQELSAVREWIADGAPED
jgi:hypothetical protein